MRVHHLNCGTMCPGRNPFTRLVPSPETIVCHCLLIETNDGLVLVDTGLGLQDVQHPDRAMHALFRWLSHPRLDPAETAWHQVQALGFKPDDVRHIVVTHLDMDHAGGLADFPQAQVHVLGIEQAVATAPAGWLAQHRYRAAQWAHGPRWVCYEPAGEPWFGFESVRELQGLPPEILLVPLAGHSPGHSGVAVDLGDRWLLHAGDAYYVHDEVHTPPYRPVPGMQLFTRANEVDRDERLHNLTRLRQLVTDQGGRVQVVCAHDAGEWAACAHPR